MQPRSSSFLVPSLMAKGELDAVIVEPKAIRSETNSGLRPIHAAPAQPIQLLIVTLSQPLPEPLADWLSEAAQ